MGRFIFIFCIVCFVNCGLSKNSNLKNKDPLLQDVEDVNSKSDWKSDLGLSSEEFDTLTFLLMH
ncbi:hypothetical protein [Borreliella carolinensis]|uniref:hypothetical protein n=1 Tax=Borreliella carolinensis TaxID=478174 RepID=UPI002943155B|nr:hypothetical protein [Borreliella carolinensis]WNY65420.1 hypothetical protein QIA46_04455 [Borreliella carolinensis]